jgi:hypothetical protein
LPVLREDVGLDAPGRHCAILISRAGPEPARSTAGIRDHRLMPFRRRFGEVVDRQLELFERDELDGLLAGVAAAKRAYDRAGRDEAEEAYGDYDDARIAAVDALVELRDRYASTLDEDAAGRYAREFTRRAGRRFPELAAELERS